ncbi:MAG TPA: hypothetical protein VKT29_00620 [Terriglobales bacterium]|nr:hypothetical protein [Terriglobales bacterium]
MESNPDLARQEWGRLANEIGQPEGEGPKTPVLSEQETAAPDRSSRGRGQLWARRLGLLVFVLLCLELGIVLVVLPWTRIWIDNNLLLNYPTLRFWAANTFVRGAFSGLGLIDVWLGIWEVVRYREK